MKLTAVPPPDGGNDSDQPQNQSAFLIVPELVICDRATDVVLLLVA